MDDFILPDTWCIKITEDNRKIINDWKIKQPVLNDDLFKHLQYIYVNHGRWLDQMIITKNKNYQLKNLYNMY